MTEQQVALIIGGVLDIVMVCPKCGHSNHRTIDYRIVDVTGVSCEECETIFSVKVQNVFDAAQSAHRVEELEKALREIAERCAQLQQRRIPCTGVNCLGCEAGRIESIAEIGLADDPRS